MAGFSVKSRKPAARGSTLVRGDHENPGLWPLHRHILYHACAGMSIGF